MLLIKSQVFQRNKYCLVESRKWHLGKMGLILEDFMTKMQEVHYKLVEFQPIDF